MNSEPAFIVALSLAGCLLITALGWLVERLAPYAAWLWSSL